MRVLICGSLLSVICVHAVVPRRDSYASAIINGLPKSTNLNPGRTSTMRNYSKVDLELDSRQQRALDRVRECARTHPMQSIVSALLGKESSTIVLDPHGSERVWKDLATHLLKLPLSVLDGIGSECLSDVDLHFHSQSKLVGVLGPANADLLLQVAGVRANRRLKEIEKQLGIENGHSSTPPLADLIQKITGSEHAETDRYGERMASKPLVSETAARVANILFALSRPGVGGQLTLLVNVENEAVLRFAVGPVAATELLLVFAPRVLVEDMSPALRSTVSLADYLVNARWKVRKLAIWFKSDSVDLMESPLFRPRNFQSLRFLVGPERANQLMTMFPNVYANHLLRAGELIRNPVSWNPHIYRGDLLRVLKENVRSSARQFWLISVSNRDRLESLFGPAETRWLLQERGYMVLTRLFPAEMKKSTQDFNVFKKLESLLPPHLGDFAHLFTPNREMELAFLVGPEAAKIMAPVGIKANREVRSNRRISQLPQKSSFLDTLYPSEKILKPLITKRFVAAHAVPV